MKGLGKAKLFSREREEDLLIEAMAPVDGKTDGKEDYRPIAFRASRIDCIFGIAEDISAIRLDSGVTIPVALPFQRLKASVYDNDFSTGDSIDLTLVTGKAVREAEKVTLSKTFNPVAKEAPQPAEGQQLKVTLFARAKPSDRQFRLLTFSEHQVDFFEPSASRKATDTYVSLKDGCEIEGWTSFYVALPLQHFTYYITQAKQNGRDQINLADETRPRDASALKMD